MPRYIILTLFSIIVFSSNAYSQKYYELTSKIFFNVDIKNHDIAILSEFNAKPELTLEKDTGWVGYPPTDGKRNQIPFYTFSFSKHLYFTSDLNYGRLVVITNKESNKVVGMLISLAFVSAEIFDSTYKSLKKIYSKYASKTIIRTNIAKPFEVTKYLSKDGSSYIIITKGESSKKPYMHIAYNYQGYDW